jgi:hypothetical protein
MNSNDIDKHKPLSDKIYELYKYMENQLKVMVSVDGSGNNRTPEEDFVNRLLASLRPYFTWGLFAAEQVPRGPSPKKALDTLDRDKTAILGFAFGMTKTGRPGISNKDIAEVVKDYVNIQKYSDWDKVFIQWEIADALEEHQIPQDHIVWPPLFTSDDIQNPDKLIRRLRCRKTPLLQHVYDNLPEDVQQAITHWDNSQNESVEWLVYGLNTLLHKNKFHINIPDELQLPQLNHDLAFEVRKLPPKTIEGHDNKLGQGQAIRVNRLILESIFPEELVSGEYLSSMGVLEKVIGKLQCLGIQNVIVVAHPDHMYRCYELVQKVASDMHMSLTTYIADCTKVKYDPDSAQSWTRNTFAFWEYDIISRSREVVLKQIREELKNR